MTTIRGSLPNPWWAAMYNRYSGSSDPSNQHYGHFSHTQIHQPLTIDSNNQYTIELDRHCGSLCAYNIGGVSPAVRRNMMFNRIDMCSDETGAPHLCAKSYLGKKADFNSGGSGYQLRGGDGAVAVTGYDRLGA